MVSNLFNFGQKDKERKGNADLAVLEFLEDIQTEFETAKVTLKALGIDTELHASLQPIGEGYNGHGYLIKIGDNEVVISSHLDDGLFGVTKENSEKSSFSRMSKEDALKTIYSTIHDQFTDREKAAIEKFEKQTDINDFPDYRKN